METPNSNPVNIDPTKISFSLTDITLPYAYINSIPSGVYLVSIHEDIKGAAKGRVNGFRFYEKPYHYVSARFNLNDHSKIDCSMFLFRIETMFSTLQYLNRKPIRSLDMMLILRHIKKYSNYVFSVREVYLIARKFQYNPSLVNIKTRDYKVEEMFSFKKRNEFADALNNARKVVNSTINLKELFYLLEERIANNDYGYLNEAIIIGHKNNHRLIYAMVRKFNLLCTGLQRKERKQVKREPLYCNSLKRLTLKAISLKPKQQNAFMQKGIIVYERELKAFNQLVNNRKMAQQMFLILGDLTGLDVQLEIIPDVKVKNQLKAELMNVIQKKASKDLTAESIEFDRIYQKPIKKEIPLNTNLSDAFDTDMKNSIFNQLSLEQVLSKGDGFYYEYMEFRNREKIKGRMNFGILQPN